MTMSTCQPSLTVVMVGMSTLVNILSMSLHREMRSSPPCERMWTGTNCTYRCNCREYACGEQVYCVDGAPCIDDYFGASCQHVDLAKEAKASQGQVNDHDKTTCTTAPRVVLTFPLLYPFTFMRLGVNDSDKIVGVVVTFRTSPSLPPLPCRNLYRFGISRQVFEIHCDLEGAYNQMEISWSGPGSVCDIYISGGRNIALRSKTTAGEHVGQSGPDNVVDGVDSKTLVGACYQSKVASTFPYWTAEFSRGWMVNRILVVGRHGKHKIC